MQIAHSTGGNQDEQKPVADNIKAFLMAGKGDTPFVCHKGDSPQKSQKAKKATGCI